MAALGICLFIFYFITILKPDCKLVQGGFIILNHKQASAHGNIRVSCSCVYVTHEQKSRLKKEMGGNE